LAAGFALDVLDGDAPALFHTFASTVYVLLIGIAGPFLATRLAAFVNGGLNVEDGGFAENNIVAARIDGVAGPDFDGTLAIVADNFEPTDNTWTVKEAVVQAVLREDVILEAVEIEICETLPREEARAFEALKADARRAAAWAFRLVLRYARV
jgi:hypothetical protein